MNKLINAAVVPSLSTLALELSRASRDCQEAHRMRAKGIELGLDLEEN